MSLINEALKKHKIESRGGTAGAFPVEISGPPRAGNPATTTAFRWLSIGVGLVIAASLSGAIVAFILVVLFDDSAAGSRTGQNNSGGEVEVVIGQGQVNDPESAQRTGPAVPTRPLPVSTPRPVFPGSESERLTTLAPGKNVEKAADANVSEMASERPDSASEGGVPARDMAAVEGTLSQSEERPIRPRVLFDPLPPATPVREMIVVAGDGARSQPVESAASDGSFPSEGSVQPPLDLAAHKDPQVMQFLEESRITGIRAAGTSSRVIMNGETYKLGSIVESSSQLRITSILENEIHFIDASGAQYRKRFRR